MENPSRLGGKNMSLIKRAFRNGKLAFFFRGGAMGFEISVKHHGKYKKLKEEPAQAENPISLFSTLTYDHLAAPSAWGAPRFAEFLYTSAAAPDIAAQTESGYVCAVKWDGATTAAAGAGKADSVVYLGSSFWGGMSSPYNTAIPKYFAVRACDASGALDKSEITHLSVMSQKITGLRIDGLKSLKCLSVYNNKLCVLPLHGLDAIEELDCSRNKLKRLDVSGLAGLKSLSCHSNFIERLDLPETSGMTYLDASFNKLKSISFQKYELNYNGFNLNDNLLESADVSRLEIGPEFGYGCGAGLNFSNNRLSAAAIDKIFGDVPDISRQPSGVGYIYVSGNPGSAECDKAIAQARGWQVWAS
jgi:Leucine-rich repeat (LRR) protein